MSLLHYPGADNVMPTPLIVPKIDWSPAVSFSQTSGASSVGITNPAMPGFDIQMQSSATATSAASGTVKVAVLSAALSAQHMSRGVSTGMVLLSVTGSGLSGNAQLTLPNTAGFAPGSVLSLMMLNPLTGGHDAVGLMKVSADGQTMTSTGLISFGGAAGSSSGGPSPEVTPDISAASFSVCLFVIPQPPIGMPMQTCLDCQSTAGGAAQRRIRAVRHQPRPGRWPQAQARPAEGARPVAAARPVVGAHPVVPAHRAVPARPGPAVVMVVQAGEGEGSLSRAASWTPTPASSPENTSSITNW